MCARYSLTKDGIKITIGEIEVVITFGARYNIAPAQKAAVIIQTHIRPAELQGSLL